MVKEYKISIKKNLLVFLILQSLGGVISAQINKGEIDSVNILKPNLHFQPEYLFDVSTQPEKWIEQKPGLHISFVSTDVAYFRSEVPELKNESLVWQYTGWKGERLNAQIIVWSPDTLNQVRFQLHDLVNAKGQILGKNNMKLNMIRYVLSNQPYGAVVGCGDSPVNNAYLMPDRFEAFERFDVPGKTVRPVWLSLNIPSDAKPGIYKGSIEIETEKHKAVLQLEIDVQNQLLPIQHDWKFRLDLWQNPCVIADYHGVKPWSHEHKSLLKQHLKLYADVGGKCITTYAVYSPWADITYRINETMIEWTKLQNDKWEFDYSIFDQYVQLAMEMGIDKAITIYTPIPYNNRFRYKDEKTGNYIFDSWAPESESYKTFWNIFLTDLKFHLEKKGWFEKTYLGINENPIEQTLTVINLVKAHSKKWKIAYAGDWNAQLDSLIDDYSSVYRKEPNLNEVSKRSSLRKTSTYYICCTPPKPNTFVFSPPVESRWLGWYTIAKDYDGLLRWAYDAWTADPLRDSRHIYWASGDCFLVYPSAASSIRFEKMREGIVDHEKILILRTKAAKSTDKRIKLLLRQLEQHLQVFTTEVDFKESKLIDDINKGRKIVEELSEKL